MVVRGWHELEAETPTFTLVIKDGGSGVALKELNHGSKEQAGIRKLGEYKVTDFVEGEDFEVIDDVIKNS